MEKMTSLLRLRMSAKDAHYGGNLVDGAHMVHLFGDVATELLIKCDGDEGLFCAYDNVEFLAPVYAGDYIEAYGEIEKIGNTSRTMRLTTLLPPPPTPTTLILTTFSGPVSISNAMTVPPASIYRKMIVCNITCFFYCITDSVTRQGAGDDFPEKVAV